MQCQLYIGGEANAIVAADTCFAADGGMEHTCSKIGPRKRRMAAVRGVEVIEQVARNGGIISVCNHGIMHGFVGQANRCNPDRISSRGDVLSVPSVTFCQPRLHGGEVVVERVETVSISVSPRHEHHRLCTFVCDSIAEQNGGVFAVLPHGVRRWEGGDLALVLQHHIIPRRATKGRVPLIPGCVDVGPMLGEFHAAAVHRANGAVDVVSIDHALNQ